MYRGVGAVFSMIALVYMRIFLEDSVPAGAAMTQPLLKCEVDSSKITTGTFKKLPSAGDLISMLKCSPTFSQAVVLFFSSLADGGLMASLLYYLKARFQFNKNQFADLMMISGIGATLTMITIRYEYGMVQGCLSGISSLANIISPLVSSPLTALFLSHDAPYYFPGFSLMCLGLALMAAFFQSLMIRSVPPIVVGETSSNHCTETLA